MNQRLKDIFDNDPFGLLTLKPATNHRNAEERLVASFQAIVQFYEDNSKEPEYSRINIQECDLFYQLKNLRANKEKWFALKSYDDNGLLEVAFVEKQITPFIAPKIINSIDDILNDDSFGLLDNDESIFELKHIQATDKEREKADFVARRKSIKDFDRYETLFKQVHADLKEGNRKLTKFSEDDIKQGIFFLVNGVLVFVDEVYDIQKVKHSKLDGRIRCVFENGTASNLLFRSLGKALYKNGQSVTQLLYNEGFIKNELQEADVETGFIYILKSKSTNTKIVGIPNLYKIGFSTVPVEERIKNAVKEPTYLMADVQIITSYKCYNINPQKFENFIHNFFSKVCLAIDIYDEKSNRHIPREWFSVPLKVIEETIELIVTDKIKGYYYDDEREQLERI